jgi:hypothetical protein
LQLVLEGEALRNAASLPEYRSHGRSVVAAPGLPVEARRPWCPYGIAPELLHAIAQTILPSLCLRVELFGALADADEIGAAGMEAADVGL